MLRYLKAAFFARVDVPALGRVPANVLAMFGFGALGFTEPGFWFLGGALETAYLFSLALNRRFQKVVDALDLQVSADDAESKRQALVRALSPAGQERCAALERKCARVYDIFRSQQADAFVIDASRDALQRLEWVYLKLLVAQHNLETLGGAENADVLSRRIADLEHDLAGGEPTEALRISKQGTLANLRERFDNLRRKEQTVEEITSDLTRIESQVDLVVERALLQGKPQAISTDIELASNLVSSGVFGDSEVAVADLDEIYGARAAAKPSRVRETA